MKSSIHRIIALIMRHMFSWRRSLERLWDTFWWPTFNLFTWGILTMYLQNQGTGSRVIDMFLGGVMMWMLVNQSQEEMGLVFLQEAWDRNILNILSSPVSIWEFTIASVSIGVLKLVVSGIWLMVLSYALFHFSVFQYGFILIPYAICLLVSGWALGFVVNGLILRYGFRVQVFAWSISLLFQPFSAVFFPLSILPQWMIAISRLLPTSYIFEGMRGVLANETIDGRGLLIACVLNVFYVSVAALFFVRSYRASKATGMLVKFS